MSQDQLDAAFKDLDINKDGIIDYNEFRTWYFSGMKPFSGNRRSLLKAMGGILAFNKVTADPKLLEFVTQNPDTVTQRVGLGFNPPQAP